MTDTSAQPPLDEPPDASQRSEAHAGAPEIALPLRFIWQSDDAGRIGGVSPELLAAMGPDHPFEGRTWDELLSEPGLDSSGGLAQALSRRDTWSGVSITWRLAGGFDLGLELAGLPVFDRASRPASRRGTQGRRR